MWRGAVCDDNNRKSHKYVCITTNQPDNKPNCNPNPNSNRTTKQHAIVNIQLNMVTYPIYHSVNSSSHSINGDIEIRWEWSKFDP